MLDNLESRITFEVPTNVDFDKLIRDNNYTLFWQNLHGIGGGGGEPYRQSGEGLRLEPAPQGDRNSSDFNLMSSLKHFAGERSGGYGWGVLTSDDGAVVGGDPFEGPLVDPSYLWIGAVMVLLILSGLFCVCSCYLYYKYRKWQKCVSVATCHTLSNLDVESPPPYDAETLPSYTIASGLPSYEDALRHLSGQQQGPSRADGYEPARKPSSSSVHPQSRIKFFESRPQNWLNVTIFEEIHYNFVGRGTSAVAGGDLLVDAPKPVAVADRPNGETKPEPGNGLFKIQICMLENEKDQTSRR